MSQETENTNNREIRNLNKKYPIAPEQLLTGRKECLYCLPSSNPGRALDPMKKCSTCGFGSEDLMRAILMGTFEHTHVPMVLIERVNCDGVDEKDERNELDTDSSKEDSYYKYNNEIYRMINAYSFTSNVIVDSACYLCRKTYPWLTDFCQFQDAFSAERAFKAIDENDEKFFALYEDTEEPFDYYAYKCAVSGLTEIIIPLYTRANAENRSDRGVVGFLIIGQRPIGAPPKGMEDIAEFEEQRKWIRALNENQRVVVEDLRKSAWFEERNIEKPKKTYKDSNDALKGHAEHIRKFFGQIKDEIIAQETGFIHKYQSKRIKEFLDFIALQKQDAKSIKKRIVTMFKKIWRDFDLNELHVFIPDLEMKAESNQTLIEGQVIGSKEHLSVKIDITKLPPPSSYEVDVIELEENEGLYINETLVPAGESEENTTEKINEFDEFYAAAYSGENEKTMFGVFVEWKTLPIKHGDTANRLHKDLFKALVGICSAEIMAFLAVSRSSKLTSFAEETRHDLAHRLQTLDSHNRSFVLDCDNFFESELLYPLKRKMGPSEMIERFNKNSLNYIKANKELFETLSYMKDELDSVNVYREPKPEQIYAVKDVFMGLRQLFTAPWHPRNAGHTLHVPKTEWFTNKVWADKIMFRRIIQNLLDNAFKYSPPKTNVYISHYYDSVTKEICFDVINFGFGIKEEFEKTMFERGKKGPAAAAGKGLGLAIARDFAERNGGTLDIVSGIIPGSGTEKDKKKNGLVSKVNFTQYNDILEFQNDYPQNNKLDYWAEKLRQERDELNIAWDELPGQESYLEYKGGYLFTLAEAFGKDTPLKTVMVKPDDKNPSRKTKQTTGDLIAYAEHEIYQVTFRLRLPAMDIKLREDGNNYEGSIS